jgi:UDP-N-acetylmuramate--alanine ligase
MENLNYLKSVYFMGIGGIGMSAIARYFNHNNVKVAGYDKTISPLTQELESEGINIHYEDDLSKIPDLVDLCVITPAVPKFLNELNEISLRGIPVMKRSEVLGLITDNRNTIAIAGTHGKTSTTALTAHLLKTANLPVNAFIGGISANYNTNLLLADNSDLFVVEADEFDRSFLTLHPKYGVITSVDADHLDIYGDKDELKHSFVDFSNQVSQFLLVNESIKDTFNLQKSVFTYAINSSTADYSASNLNLADNIYSFDLTTPQGQILNIEFGIGGEHNIENAVAASALALQQGISIENLRLGLKTFRGVHRRFESVIISDKLIYIDDYAHHPAEITACLTSIRKMYPNRKITAVFQPHLFSRTRDFVDDFADSLALADNLILLDIYPAREEPIEGITGAWLLSKVKMENKWLVEKSELNSTLISLNPELIVTMGAGDIDRLVEGVKNACIQNFNIKNDE